jgi:hypothetical protein
MPPQTEKAPSRIRADLQPDARLTLDARYTLGPGDRLYIDDQIVAVQEHIARCLINGLVATYYRVDPDAGALQAGDVVVKRPGARESTVVRAEPAALAVAGAALGVVVTPAPPGAFALVALWGLLPPQVSGLAYQKGEARVSAAGRVELVEELGADDFPLGLVDQKGWLLLRPDRRGQATAIVADEAPTPGTVVLRGKEGQAKAAWLEAGTGGAAELGLVRAASGTVAVASRNAAGTADISALAVGVNDRVKVGSAPALGVVLEADSASAATFRFGLDRLRVSASELAFTSDGTFLITQDAPSAGAGGVARIAAPHGSSKGGAGGELRLEAGVPGKPSDPAGAIVLDAQVGDDGQASGPIKFAAGGGAWLTWTLEKASGTTGRATASVPLEVGGPHVRILPDAHGEALIRSEGTGRTRIAHGGDTRIEVDSAGVGFFGVPPVPRAKLSGSCGGIPALIALVAQLEGLASYNEA